MSKEAERSESYKVITPAGSIYVKYASAARDYKELYGYPFVRLTTNTT